MGLLHGVQGALEPVYDVGFCGDRLFHPLFRVGGHFGPRNAEQIKIREGDVHVDFAGGAHARRGTPGEFFFGSGFGEREQLAGHVAPLAVIALPDSFRGRLESGRAMTASGATCPANCSRSPKPLPKKNSPGVPRRACAPPAKSTCTSPSRIFICSALRGPKCPPTRKRGWKSRSPQKPTSSTGSSAPWTP